MKNQYFYQKGMGCLVISLLTLSLLTGCGAKQTDLKELAKDTQIDAVVESTSQESAKQTEQSVSEQTEQSASEQTEQGKWYVHVCGAVKTPGVYEMASGSRGFEAVRAAGGFTDVAAEDYVNLAEPLFDGARLEIPTGEEVTQAKKQGNVLTAGISTMTRQSSTMQAGGSPSGESHGASGSGAQAFASDVVNINTADLTTLCTLPGVGESRAQSIIAYREEHGGFQKCEDIMQVTGIKEGLYGKIKDRICVG